jgi:MFS family permease
VSALTEAAKEGFVQVGKSFRNTPAATKKFLADPKTAVGGASLVPLTVLLGHTFIDALDGAGFLVILPDIQKDFDITLSQATGIGGLALLVSFLLAVPVAVKSEATTHRTFYLGAGAVIAAVFAVMSGAATTLGLFLLARSGFGLGLRLNDPVQQSLLADYYPVHTRSTVFSSREGLTRAGRLVGPVFFGAFTVLFGWRSAIFAVAVPSAVLAWYSFRLPNPVRGAPEREAAGLPPVTEEKIVNPPTLKETFRILKRIGTVRRLWWSLPFLVGGLLALAILLPSLMEEVFGLDALGRGWITAAGEAAAIIGLLVATPAMTRYLTGGNPEKVFPFLSMIAVVLSVMLVGVAVAPNIAAFIFMLVLTNFTGAILGPAVAVLISMVVPPRVRTISFATVLLWVLPGLLFIPIASGIGDVHGLRWAVAMAIPMFLIGALILTSSGPVFVKDLNANFAAMARDFEAQHPTSGDDGDSPVHVAPFVPVVAETAPRRPRKPAPTPPPRREPAPRRVTPQQLRARSEGRTGGRKKI